MRPSRRGTDDEGQRGERTWTGHQEAADEQAFGRNGNRERERGMREEHEYNDDDEEPKIQRNER